MPNFGYQPTATNLSSGAWSDATNWSGGAVPPPGAVVRIKKNTVISYDVIRDAELKAVGIEGTLRFATDRSTRLRVTNLLVYDTGHLEIGSQVEPVASNSIAEIVINDTPLETGSVSAPGTDPLQFGTSFIAYGKVTMHGRKMKATYLTPAMEPRSGQSTITLQSTPEGWQVGDVLAFADDSQPWEFGLSHTMYGGEGSPYNYKGEERSIAAINGNTVTLDAPLLYNHLGARNVDGTLTVLADGSKLIPPVANLSRNIIIRSNNPNGTRGHTAFFGRAVVDIRYAQFKDMGRTTAEPIDSSARDGNGTITKIGTNQLGRYSYHYHHVVGPSSNPPRYNGVPAQHIGVGNSIWGGKRWGYVIHGTHFGLDMDNVIYDVDGAGLTVEDGTEYGNVIERNYVLKISGPDNPIEIHQRGDDGSQRVGHGFWIQGTGNYFRNNIVGNARAGGYNIFRTSVENSPFLRGMAVPTKPGDDPHHDSVVRYDESSLVPVLEFNGNRVFGSISGFETWRMNFEYARPTITPFAIKDFVSWNVHRVLRVPFATSAIEVDGFLARGSKRSSFTTDSRYHTAGLSLDGGYISHRLLLKNFDIQGYDIGVNQFTNLSGQGIELRNGILRNFQNVEGILNSAETRAAGNFFKLILDSVKHEAMPGQPLNALRMSAGAIASERQPVAPEWRILVKNHNGSGQNYENFVPEQKPDFVIPPAQKTWTAETQSLRYHGCPAGDGLTNQQCFDAVGVAIGMRVAPCRQNGDPDCTGAENLARTLGMAGLVFPVALSVPNPPSTPPQVYVISPTTSDGSIPQVSYRIDFDTTIVGNRTNVGKLVAWLDNEAPIRVDVAQSPLEANGFHSRIQFYPVAVGSHTIHYHLEDAGGAIIPGSAAVYRVVR